MARRGDRCRAGCRTHGDGHGHAWHARRCRRDGALRQGHRLPALCGHRQYRRQPAQPGRLTWPCLASRHRRRAGAAPPVVRLLAGRRPSAYPAQRRAAVALEPARLSRTGDPSPRRGDDVAAPGLFPWPRRCGGVCDPTGDFRMSGADDIDSLRAENDALRAELDETNQGVLALYAELDNQAEQLRQASELKSRFLSYMSHEFRTPLGSILSMTRLLHGELDGPLNQEQHKQLAFVTTAARDLSDMVDDLLDLAKIEAGRITISPAWFELMDLFTALRGMFRPIVDMTEADLIFEAPA